MKITLIGQPVINAQRDDVCLAFGTAMSISDVIGQRSF